MTPTVLFVLASAAWSQEEACAGRYANGLLLDELAAIDASFRAVEIDRAREQISSVHRNLLCLDEPVDALGVARLSRQLALAFFFDQDEDAMRRWSRLTRTVAPDLPWHADLAAEHPFREAIESEPPPGVAGPGASLALPKRSTLLWNGRLITKAEAPVETPGLVQLFDKNGALLRAWWQHGSAFPDDLLGPPGADPRPPKGWADPESDPRFAEHAALPLFGEVEIAAAEPPPPIDVDEATLAAAREEEVAGEYVDPFELARRRAIRRQYFERSTINAAGDTVHKKIEVVTLAADDRSGGRPITYEIWQYWLEGNPEWQLAAARASGHAGEGYLQDWIDGRPPPNTARTPLVWVPAAAAVAYCASFGKMLPPEGAVFDDPLAWEWRVDAAPVRANAKGKIKKDSPVARGDTGFRCIDP